MSIDQVSNDLDNKESLAGPQREVAAIVTLVKFDVISVYIVYMHIAQLLR